MNKYSVIFSLTCILVESSVSFIMSGPLIKGKIYTETTINGDVNAKDHFCNKVYKHWC